MPLFYHCISHTPVPYHFQKHCFALFRLRPHFLFIPLPLSLTCFKTLLVRDSRRLLSLHARRTFRRIMSRSYFSSTYANFIHLAFYQPMPLRPSSCFYNAYARTLSFALHAPILFCFFAFSLLSVFFALRFPSHTSIPKYLLSHKPPLLAAFAVVSPLRFCYDKYNIGL